VPTKKLAAMIAMSCLVNAYVNQTILLNKIIKIIDRDRSLADLSFHVLYTWGKNVTPDKKAPKRPIKSIVSIVISFYEHITIHIPFCLVHPSI